MVSSSVYAIFGGTDDTEMTSHEFQSTMLENISYTELASQPLDLTVVTNKCDEACKLQPLRCEQQNAPGLKHMSMPITENKPFDSTTSNTDDLLNMKPSAPTISESIRIAAADSTIQTSETKVALKFSSKKCDKVNLNFRSRSIAPTNNRLQSLVKSLKNTMKSLAKTIPLTKVISKIHDSLSNKINGKRLQDCVELLGLPFKPFKKQKRAKNSRKSSNSSVFRKQKRSNEATFVNPMKKPELEHLAGFQFAKPKFYECSDCNTRFYKLKLYFRHIRRHAGIIRCDKCSKAFSSIINKRQHQLYCRQRNT